MKRGRPLGSIEISVTEIVTIKKLSSEGFTNKEIAKQLGRSPTTVWSYKKLILQ